MTDDSRIGVDVGGTFTDVVSLVGGEVRVTKVPSTPEAPEEGVVTGVETAIEAAGIAPGAIDALAHGTTVATNAVLEGEWADTALLTTEGFRDVLEIGRQDRPALYDLRAEKAAPIVPRDRRFEVAERLDERGDVLDALDEGSVREAVTAIPEGIESVAVSLLFSFEDPSHERRIADLLAERDLSYSLSSEVHPEIREYERTLVTALDAALSPVMEDYLGALESGLEGLGLAARLRVMGSNGGSMAAETARDNPVRTLLSGPAAGVRGAAHVAGLAGIEDAITMDMGGTSCDVSLVRGGDPVVSTEVEVGDYPVAIPTIDVHTVGSGGGSIARIDEGGALRVGPRSAGADPGPVCYGRGGERPTVTDAHFLLGRLDPGRFGAAFEPDREAVERAIGEDVADPLDMGVEEAAAGVLEVANADMERALRVVSIERGHDPRDLGIVAFGGAGPLHAVELADALDVPRVLVPRAAGVLSAVGLLASDVIYDLSTSRVRDWDAVDPAAIETVFERFEAEADDRLATEGVPKERRTFERSLDLRYAGQAYDLTVEAPDAIDGEALDDLADRFHDRHEARYGYASPGEPIELVAVRLRARGEVEPPDLRLDSTGGTLADARRERRRAWFEAGTHNAPVYDRGSLPASVAFEGPAIVEGPESTTVLPPGASGEVDEYGNLVVEVA